MTKKTSQKLLSSLWNKLAGWLWKPEGPNDNVITTYRFVRHTTLNIVSANGSKKFGKQDGEVFAWLEAKKFQNTQSYIIIEKQVLSVPDGSVCDNETAKPYAPEGKKMWTLEEAYAALKSWEEAHLNGKNKGFHGLGEVQPQAHLHYSRHEASMPAQKNAQIGTLSSIKKSAPPTKKNKNH